VLNALPISSSLTWAQVMKLHIMQYSPQRPVLRHLRSQKAIILYILGIFNNAASISDCKLLLIPFEVLSHNLFWRMYENHKMHQDSWSPVRDLNLQLSLYKACVLNSQL
jgi:hypothetical protein